MYEHQSFLFFYVLIGLGAILSIGSVVLALTLRSKFSGPRNNRKIVIAVITTEIIAAGLSFWIHSFLFGLVMLGLAALLISAHLSSPSGVFRKARKSHKR